MKLLIKRCIGILICVIVFAAWREFDAEILREPSVVFVSSIVRGGAVVYFIYWLWRK